MLIIPDNPNRSKNEERFPCKDGQQPCIICGRPCNMDTAAVVLLADCQKVGDSFGLAACTPEEFRQTEPGCRLYCYPIGPDCLKAFPALKPYILPEGFVCEE